MSITFNMADVKEVAIDKLRLDGGTQMRVSISQDAVDEYAEAYRDGDRMPYPTAYFDSTDYWVSDGHHRCLAARKAGLKSLKCNVHQGTQRDAILWACKSNYDHGLRRTNADKRMAVLTLLNDSFWSTYSDRKIAEHCIVSHNFVSELRRQVSSDDTCEPQKRVGKNGVAQAATKKRRKCKSAAERYRELHVPPIDDEPSAATATHNVEACPNCGCTERTEDGDCSSCYEPCGEQDDKKPKRQKKVANLRMPSIDADEQTQIAFSQGDARRTVLKTIAEFINWLERFAPDRTDKELAWYGEPNSPGMFDHGLTTERVAAAASQLDRIATHTFSQAEADA